MDRRTIGGDRRSEVEPLVWPCSVSTCHCHVEPAVTWLRTQTCPYGNVEVRYSAKWLPAKSGVDFYFLLPISSRQIADSISIAAKLLTSRFLFSIADFFPPKSRSRFLLPISSRHHPISPSAIPDPPLLPAPRSLSPLALPPSPRSYLDSKGIRT